MKRVLKLIPAFLFVLVYACDNEQVVSSYPFSSTYSILSRGEGDGTSLPTGSQILLNASGGISVVNGVFTYNGNTWTNEQEIQWTETPSETTITALYPTFPNNEYSLDNLYSDGMLEDILIAQDILSEKGEINLQFKHLFSSLTLHLAPTLVTQLQDLTLSIPIQIEHVNPQDGTYSLRLNTHTVSQSNKGDNVYTFILPPSEEYTLTLLLTLLDGTNHEVNFTPHTFLSGHHYTCNISQYDTRPGIRDAEDLIAFCQLINGTYEGEETLDSFGEVVDEQRVYRLLSDITLTEEECQRLSPIGDESAPFADIFDGEGHTISELTLPDVKYTGLFGHVGSAGIVRNLHINKASSVNTLNTSYVGGIASISDGTIDNCSVTNSNLYTIEKGYMGGICALTGGTILNCYTQNTIYHVNTSAIAGGIVGSANGNILNCYTKENQFTSSNKNNRLGSIAGMSTPRTTQYINNCYIFHSQNTQYWGAAVGTSSKVTIQYFYYNRGDVCKTKDAKTTISDTSLYDSDYCIDSAHISQLLNEWVETTGAATFPNYTFNKWMIAADSSACFQ